MEWFINKTIGLSLSEFRTVVNILNLQWRVVRADDEGLVVTRDYNPNRFNVHLRDGIVAEITLG